MDLKLLFGVLLAVIIQGPEVLSHGRMMNPPARNTAWRFGYPCPVNYNDNEQFCGGYKVHQLDNDGKCGMCGDDYNLPVPRPHETGGKFGAAVITRRYYSGQNITVQLDITSNHMGSFYFKICSIHPVDKDCINQGRLDRNIIPVIRKDGSLARKYVIESREKSFSMELNLQLPSGFNCSRCSFQWTYVTGNSVGICEDGKEALGCGKQETFINCADVSVMPMPYNYNINKRDAGNYPMDPRLTSTSRANPYRKYYRDVSRMGAPMTALAVRFQRCCAVNNTGHTPGMDDSCQSRCMKYPPDCPQETCKCVKDVFATAEFRREREMADQWCLDQCNVYPARDCDESKCVVIYTAAPETPEGFLK